MTQPAAASDQRRMAEASSSSEIAKTYVRQKFDLDTDFLECSICWEAFSPPVYQCESGHTTCSACGEKITKGCPSCSQPTGRIRNIAIEKVVESLQVECKRAGHGCNTMVKYTERAKHEKDLCEYRPISCPVIRLFPDCTYTGPKVSIPMHLTEKHGVRIVECSGSMRSATFKMKITDREVMFKAKEAWLLVCCYRKGQGDSIYCGSIISKEVAYKLTVKRVKLNRMSSKVYSMQNVVHDEHKELWDWKDNYLFVPGWSKEFLITVSLV